MYLDNRPGSRKQRWSKVTKPKGLAAIHHNLHKDFPSMSYLHGILSTGYPEGPQRMNQEYRQDIVKHCRIGRLMWGSSGLRSSLAEQGRSFINCAALQSWEDMHFSQMRSKGSRFTLGVRGLRVRSLDVAFASATVRNRSQPSAPGPYGRAYDEFRKSGDLWRFQTSRSLVSRGRRGTL